MAAHGAQSIALFSGLIFLFSRPFLLPRHPASLGLSGLLLWQGVSALASPVPWAAWRAVAGLWSVSALAVVALWTWDDRQKRWVEYFLAGVAGLQFCLLLAAWALGREPILLFPGNAQYASFWSIAVFFLALGRVSAQASFAVWALVSCLSLAGVLLLPVRSGLLALGVGLSIFGWVKFRGRGLLAVGGILLIAVASVSSTSIERRLKLGDPLSNKRTAIWGAAGAGIAEKHLLGWGPGQFENLYWRHAAPQEGEPVRFELTTKFAHNDFLQLAAESGLPALFCLLAVLGGLAWSLRAVSPWFLAMGGALASFAAVNFPLALPADGFLIAVLFGLSGFPRTGGRTFGSRAKPLAFIGAAGLIVLGSGEALLAVNGVLGSRRILALDALDPRALEHRLERADALLHSGNPGGEMAAERELRGLLRWSPQNAGVWRDWAHLEWEHRSPPRLDQAGSAYQEALALRPFHAPWRLEWASLLAKKGDLKAAQSQLGEALRAEPRYFRAALAQANTLRLQGSPGRALRWVEGLRRVSVHWPTAGAQDSGYRREILNRDPGSLDLLAALCLLDLGRESEARAALERLEPGDTRRAALLERIRGKTP